MYCKQCGIELQEGNLFCKMCGARVDIEKNNMDSVQNKTNTMALMGLIVSGISLLLNFWGIVGIVAVILSTLGLLQINETNEKGKGMAITGISIGAFSIIYGCIMLGALM